MKFKAGVICAALLCAPISAQASDPKLVGTYGDWATYSRNDGSGQVCYVLAKPRSKQPANVKHGDIYFMIASWQSGAATEQPSLLTGFNLKNTAPTARVDNTKVPMYVAQNEAFIDSNADEKRLVNAMRAGSQMTVNATSSRGTNVTYSFSLNGITAALNKARSNCS